MWCTAGLGILALACSALGACAGSDIPVEPTPYQPFHAKAEVDHPAGGYLDERLANGTYLVTFRGTTTTPEDSVIAYAYQRAAELCGGEGRFDVLREENVSRVKESSETTTGVFGGGNWARARSDTETYRTVWPRRRLTVRCKDE